jgi:hypothetical protein
MYEDDLERNNEKSKAPLIDELSVDSDDLDSP